MGMVSHQMHLLNLLYTNRQTEDSCTNLDTRLLDLAAAFVGRLVGKQPGADVFDVGFFRRRG